jgi:hypothetical protein
VQIDDSLTPKSANPAKAIDFWPILHRCVAAFLLGYIVGKGLLGEMLHSILI